MKTEEAPDDIVIDLVCGMELERSQVKQSVMHRGETYHFCSENCKDHFVLYPEKYTGE